MKISTSSIPKTIKAPDIPALAEVLRANMGRAATTSRDKLSHAQIVHSRLLQSVVQVIATGNRSDFLQEEYFTTTPGGTMVTNGALPMRDALIGVLGYSSAFTAQGQERFPIVKSGNVNEERTGAPKRRYTWRNLGMLQLTGTGVDMLILDGKFDRYSTEIGGGAWIDYKHIGSLVPIGPPERIAPQTRAFSIDEYFAQTYDDSVFDVPRSRMAFFM